MWILPKARKRLDSFTATTNEEKGVKTAIWLVGGGGHGEGVEGRSGLLAEMDIGAGGRARTSQDIIATPLKIGYVEE